MRFILLVEGYTEKLVLGDFIRKWLDRKTEQGELKKRIGVQIRRFDGWHNLIDDVM